MQYFFHFLLSRTNIAPHRRKSPSILHCQLSCIRRETSVVVPTVQSPVLGKPGQDYNKEKTHKNITVLFSPPHPFSKHNHIITSTTLSITITTTAICLSCPESSNYSTTQNIFFDSIQPNAVYVSNWEKAEIHLASPIFWGILRF